MWQRKIKLKRRKTEAPFVKERKKKYLLGKTKCEI